MTIPNCSLDNIEEYAHSYFSNGVIQASSDLRRYVEVMALLNVNLSLKTKIVDRRQPLLPLAFPILPLSSLNLFYIICSHKVRNRKKVCLSVYLMVLSKLWNKCNTSPKLRNLVLVIVDIFCTKNVRQLNRYLFQYVVIQ
jgi:hypothetical protein